MTYRLPRPSHLAIAAMGLGLTCTAALADSNWTSAGQNLSNSRHQANEESISRKSVLGLAAKWRFDAAGDVTANPAVEGNCLYFPDAAGWLYKLDRRTGALVWKLPVSGFTGIRGDCARATPAISGDLLIMGNQSGKNLAMFSPYITPPQGAWVFAVNKHTGQGGMTRSGRSCRRWQRPPLRRRRSWPGSA